MRTRKRRRRRIRRRKGGEEEGKRKKKEKTVIKMESEAAHFQITAHSTAQHRTEQSIAPHSAQRGATPAETRN